MLQEIKTISLRLPMRMGNVNCYLIASEEGHILIDTGSAHAREELIRELKTAGCNPRSLGIILLTHGDFDHTGNAAYLRSTYGTRIAMHYDDKGMVEHGDMFASRKKPNVLIAALIPLFTSFGKSERFIPDLLIEDGYDLSRDGLKARVISLPGHSRGSIGILTVDGELFCGDLLENTDVPVLNSLIDDSDAAHASLVKLESLEIKTVYPGHGQPFAWELLRKVMGVAI
jgi:glyoxylase-like metal-dependent hydrolase (beta-lactamase superfamily II)